MLTDSHCHLSELSNEELEATIARARANDVGLLIAIGAGYGMADNLKTLKICETHDDIYCALAVHPHDAKLVTDENFSELAKVITENKKVRSVGEIGLDYHYMNSDKAVQQDVFRRFIDLAVSINKPVMIHDRDCDDDCIKILKEHGAEKCGGMVHCFSGSQDLANKYLDLGFYVSFTGIITFKKADTLRDVVKTTPLDRMLIETDSPFLAPIPHRGKKNEPAFVKLVAECVASIKGISFEEVAKVTTENAKRFFGI